MIAIYAECGAHLYLGVQPSPSDKAALRKTKTTPGGRLVCFAGF